MLKQKRHKWNIKRVRISGNLQKWKNYAALGGMLIWMGIVLGYTVSQNDGEKSVSAEILCHEEIVNAAECEPVEVVEEPVLQADMAAETAALPETDGAYGKIYLTFDDGPSPDVTPEILDILKENGVKATFFIIDYPESSIPLLKRMIEEGHTIGIHGYSHDYAAIYQSDEAFMENIKSLHDKLLADTGYDAYVVRFPGGSSNTVSKKYSNGIMTRLTQELDAEGIMYLDWNVSSGDAEGNDIPSEQLAESVACGLISGGTNVVLLHDTSAKQTTADALQEIIDNGRALGYEFYPVTADMNTIHHKVYN